MTMNGVRVKEDTRTANPTHSIPLISTDTVALLSLILRNDSENFHPLRGTNSGGQQWIGEQLEQMRKSQINFFTTSTWPFRILSLNYAGIPNLNLLINTSIRRQLQPPTHTQHKKSALIGITELTSWALRHYQQQQLRRQPCPAPGTMNRGPRLTASRRSAGSCGTTTSRPAHCKCP